MSSHGRVVKADWPWLRGCGFKLQHYILNGLKWSITLKKKEWSQIEHTKKIILETSYVLGFYTLNIINIYTVKPDLTATREQRPPVNNSQFESSMTSLNFIVSDTFVKQPLFSGPRVAVVHSFDCIGKIIFLLPTKSLSNSISILYSLLLSGWWLLGLWFGQPRWTHCYLWLPVALPEHTKL